MTNINIYLHLNNNKNKNHDKYNLVYLIKELIFFLYTYILYINADACKYI